ncbi:MAG: alpha-amylase family glycosyl hydrolase [Anaerolineae bacterium]|nr:alpha-amylase family glycosyl hydrolase [Anaerolineae bacterium]
MVDYVRSPDWINDLIIYEIATRGFTSPQGPGSGTFNSLREKLPYLQSLGINGIWLTGHSLADPQHFYNIWTQYACIEPDVIDPALGSDQEFKDMIAAAHAHGIRIFLDVIEHGVMADSPLVQRKPHWFRGKSWGMVDFDFDLHDPELDAWWVDMWTRYVVAYGVDGFRIDLGMRRADLYARVRENAARAGREIIYINELNYQGALDFSTQSELTRIPPREEFLKLIDLIQRDPPTLLSPHKKRPDEINGPQGYATRWDAAAWAAWLDSVLNRATNNETPPWAYSSGQISSHDNGWEGYEHDNPYTAQGSRCIFGYGSLFSGLVPIFVAGEEFNAPFKALPQLSPHLFGGARPGEGKWLYGGEVQWSALEQPAHQAMLHDVQQLIALRRREPLLRAATNAAPLPMRALEYTSDRPCPPPYARWNATGLIVVAGNHDRTQPVTLSLALPLADLGFAGRTDWRVTELWTGATGTYHHSATARLSVTVPADATPQGGVRVLKLEPAS